MITYEERLGNPIIVALDGYGKEEAIDVIKNLGRSVWGFKLSVLLLQHGTLLISEIREKVGSVNLMVDLQFIGNLDFIRDAILAYSLYSGDIRYIVVNANAGPEGIRAAVDVARVSRILVGSVIDSLRMSDVNLLYGTCFREEKILQFAKMAKEEGAEGIFCAAGDLEFLSSYKELDQLTKIVCGIRANGDQDKGTHRQVMTPKEALSRGATKFVLGGAVRRAEDKKKSVENILRDIRK